MKTCPYCGLNHPGGRSFGAHITNCKKNPKRQEKIEKLKLSKKDKWKEFKVNCKTCGEEIIIKEYNTDNPKKENYYCSRSCANSRGKRSDEVKNKISESLQKEKYYCKECGKIISKNKTGLCKSCLHTSKEYKEKLSKANKGKTGGYREKGGRGKQGWYKGIFCNSSWELAYVIYCKDHNIDIIRNTKGFEYIFENKTFKFYPDFIVKGKFVEVKGYFGKKNNAKISQFKNDLTIIDKKKIIPYIDYVKNKYGGDFIKLYEPAGDA